jgi:hypothetical protein
MSKRPRPCPGHLSCWRIQFLWQVPLALLHNPHPVEPQIAHGRRRIEHPHHASLSLGRGQRRSKRQIFRGLDHVLPPWDSVEPHNEPILGHPRFRRQHLEAAASSDGRRPRPLATPRCRNRRVTSTSRTRRFQDVAWLHPADLETQSCQHALSCGQGVALLATKDRTPFCAA